MTMGLIRHSNTVVGNIQLLVTLSPENIFDKIVSGNRVMFLTYAQPKLLIQLQLFMVFFTNIFFIIKRNGNLKMEMVNRQS